MQTASDEAAPPPRRRGVCACLGGGAPPEPEGQAPVLPEGVPSPAGSEAAGIGSPLGPGSAAAYGSVAAWLQAVKLQACHAALAEQGYGEDIDMVLSGGGLPMAKKARRLLKANKRSGKRRTKKQLLQDLLH